MKKINEKELLKDGIHKMKKAYVSCTGIKKRCRKVETHRFLLGYYTSETIAGDLISEASLVVRQEMKTLKVPSVKISLQNTSLEFTDGMRIESMTSDDIFNYERFSCDVNL